MKRIICFLIFLFVLFYDAASQGTDLELGAGIGAYAMNDLKALNEVIRNVIPFDTKTVADFPPFLTYSASLKFRLKNARVGFVYSFQTTGSRISGKDYSGEYRFEMTVNSGAPGIFTEIVIPAETRIDYSIYAAFNLLISTLKMQEYFEVLNDEVVNDKFIYKAQNYCFEPGFNIGYPVKSLKFSFNTGYLLQFGGRSFGRRGNEKDKLINPVTGDAIRPGWSGVRAGLSVCFSFPGKSD
jgi:hypothetical protein